MGVAMSTRSDRAYGIGALRIPLLALLLVALICVAVFAAACGSEETTTTAGPETTAGPATTAGPTTTVASTETTGTTQPLPASIKVGAVIPLTGKYAGLGSQVKGGYELAVKDINDAGGIDIGGTKVPIELSILDDESDATKTVQQLETHASNGVVAYLGGAGSDLHAAAAGIAEKNKIAYLGIAFALSESPRAGLQVPLLAVPEVPRPCQGHLRPA